jgi:hypothetical protein
MQVAWSSPSDPAKGFQYLYLSDADYSRLGSQHSKPVVQAQASRLSTMLSLALTSAA